MAGVFLVVGLGNPGVEYQFTPHNAGFLAIDAIALDHQAVVANRRCQALTAKVTLGGREVVLAKPETYMNLSGVSVAAMVREFGVDPERELLVIYDDLDLALGSIRIRPGGSPASHNGARSICSELRSEGWPRIRMGVGPVGEEDRFRRGKDYLLRPMRKADLVLLDEALTRTVEAVNAVVARGVSAAMNEFNRRDASKGPAA